MSPFILIYNLIKKEKINYLIRYGISTLIIFSIFFIFSAKLLNYFPIPLPYGSDRISFDKELWINSKDDRRSLNPRQEMLQDIIRKLHGKNKQQVISMLGEPDSKNNSELVYYLGGERSFISIDPEWLIIFFDKDGVYDKYKIDVNW